MQRRPVASDKRLAMRWHLWVHWKNNRVITASHSTLKCVKHYDDVIMDSIASQITSLTIVYSTVHSGTDQSKHQSSASLAFVWEIHRWPVNFPHKWPVTQKMFPFDDVIMKFCPYKVKLCMNSVMCSRILLIMHCQNCMWVYEWCEIKFCGKTTQRDRLIMSCDRSAIWQGAWQ